MNPSITTLMGNLHINPQPISTTTPAPMWHLPSPPYFPQQFGQLPNFLAQTAFPVPAYCDPAPASRHFSPQAGHFPVSPYYPHTQMSRWLKYIDGLPHRNYSGLQFSSYASPLDYFGLHYVSQLTQCESFTWFEDLHYYFSVPIPAILLLVEFAKEDMTEVNNGSIILPPAYS